MIKIFLPLLVTFILGIAVSVWTWQLYGTIPKQPEHSIPAATQPAPSIHMNQPPHESPSVSSPWQELFIFMKRFLAIIIVPFLILLAWTRWLKLLQRPKRTDNLAAPATSEADPQPRADID